MLENYLQMSSDEQHQAETFHHEGAHADPMLNARGLRYGTFLSNAMVSQDLKAVMRNTKRWGDLSPDKKEALEQIALKISRILTGDPEYVDNWGDTAGYATRVADDIRRRDGNA